MTYVAKSPIGDLDNWQHRTALGGNAMDFTSGGSRGSSYADFTGAVRYSVDFSVYFAFDDPVAIPFFIQHDSAIGYVNMSRRPVGNKNWFMWYYLAANPTNSKAYEFPAKEGPGQILVQHTANSLQDIVIYNGIRIPISISQDRGDPDGTPSDIVLGGAEPLRPVSRNFEKLRKMQFLNRKVTNKEARQIMNYGTCEGIIADSDFLLDVDLNKTGTAVPTTRPNTPSYTFANQGTVAYTPYYT